MSERPLDIYDVARNIADKMLEHYRKLKSTEAALDAHASRLVAVEQRHAKLVEAARDLTYCPYDRRNSTIEWVRVSRDTFETFQATLEAMEASK